MSERSLVDYVARGMRAAGCHVTKHADAWTPGIADLSFRALGVNGWLELKNATRIPARPTTVLRFEAEFTAEQAVFLVERQGKLLARVQPLRLYVGLTAEDAMEMWRVGGWPVAGWLERGRVWKQRIDWKEFLQWLTFTKPQ